ncbi:MAG: DUF1648 domain-containing protein [Anaerolineae bacterium]
MCFWQPRHSLLGRALGLFFVALLLVFDGYLFFHLLSGGFNLFTFGKGLALVLSLPLLAFLSYRVYECFTLEYGLSRDALTIFHAGSWEIIPLGEIERIWEGDGQSEVKTKVWGWPVPWLGRREVMGESEVIFYTTIPPARGLWLVAGGCTYCISPDDVKGFLEALALRRELGPVHKVRAESRPSPFLALPLWQDKLGTLLLVLALALNVALFGYLCGRYTSLPDSLPLHFDALGQVDRLGARVEIFRLPGLGGLVLLLNFVLGAVLHRRERVGAYLLWVGAIAVQVVFWLVVLGTVFE